MSRPSQPTPCGRGGADRPLVAARQPHRLPVLRRGHRRVRDRVRHRLHAPCSRRVVVVALVVGSVLLAPVHRARATRSRRPSGRTASEASEAGIVAPNCGAPVSYAGVTMSQRLTAAARREQLLDVALEVFSRNGFHATVDERRRRSGRRHQARAVPALRARSVSCTWPCCRRRAARLLDAIAQGHRRAPARRAPRWSRGFGAYFRWVADDHEAFLLLFGSGARRDEEFAEEVRARRGRHRGGHRARSSRPTSTPTTSARSPTRSSGWPRGPAATWCSSARRSTLIAWPARSPTWRGSACAAYAGCDAPRRRQLRSRGRRCGLRRGWCDRRGVATATGKARARARQRVPAKPGAGGAAAWPPPPPGPARS